MWKVLNRSAVQSGTRSLTPRSMVLCSFTPAFITRHQTDLNAGTTVQARCSGANIIGPSLSIQHKNENRKKWKIKMFFHAQLFQLERHGKSCIVQRREKGNEKVVRSHKTKAFMELTSIYLQCVCALLFGRISKLAFATERAQTLRILDFTSVVCLWENVTCLCH